MSTANDIQALRAELEATKKQLDELTRTLHVYFDTLPSDQSVLWRKAKRVVASGETETPGDVTVGKNLPQAPTRTVANNIGGALPL